ncbi:Protein of unknown function [Gryllus bimaculatus]|nr:Protein of unknown function [Gryllus bimaculatus]
MLCLSHTALLDVNVRQIDGHPVVRSLKNRERLHNTKGLSYCLTFFTKMLHALIELYSLLFIKIPNAHMLQLEDNFHILGTVVTKVLHGPYTQAADILALQTVHDTGRMISMV